MSKLTTLPVVIINGINLTNTYMPNQGYQANQPTKILVNGTDLSNLFEPNYSYNTWHHVVWTISSAGANNSYMNGTNIWSQATGIYPPSTFAYNQLFHEGTDTGHHYYGYLKEFRVYPSVLNQTQVNTLYNSGNGTLNPGI
jgi:hypothetical protein